MNYQIDCLSFNTKQILDRIKKTDLVPSLDPIKEKADEILTKFEADGLNNLEEIRKSLSSKKKLTDIALRLQIDENLLVLFKREIEGWIAKDRSIDEFDWIPIKNRKLLKEYGISSSKEAFEKLNSAAAREEISESLKIDEETLREIYGISNLMRIRWLSPTFTRIFYDLHYTVEKLHQARADLLAKEVDDYNRKVHYYKGKIGERDMNRIILESQYVDR